jgi:hypothetical protein
MNLGMIVVLTLALLFFGGIAFISWKQRNKASPEHAGSTPRPQPRDSERDEALPRRRRTG